MNAREQAFVDEHLKDLNATQAAIRAGYSEQTADGKAFRCIGKIRDDCPADKITCSGCSPGGHCRSLRVPIYADDVLQRLAEIDQMNVLDILEDGGTQKREDGAVQAI